jgi:hypothetical protein
MAASLSPKRNEAFEKMIYQTSSVKHLMKELRQIAILMYTIMSIQMSHSLWTIYLKSGMGTQKSDQSHAIKVWPIEVKSLVMKQVTNEDEDCLTYVNNCLHHLDDKMKQYQTELNTKKSHIYVDTQMIEIFVQQVMYSMDKSDFLDCFRCLSKIFTSFDLFIYI